MNINEILKQQFGQLVSLEEIQPNVMRLYAPFFHEDGDMLSIYLQLSKDGTQVRIRDFGNTLMRVSYTFDIDSDNKKSILANIINSNNCQLEDGELILNTDMKFLPEAIFRFSQTVAKVSNIDILNREVVKTLFFDYLDDYIFSNYKDYNVQKNVTPTGDPQLVVDYQFPFKKPIYLFGVNKDTKAAKVVITCLSFQKLNIPFRSFIIHEDMDALSAFYRRQITNASDKQFASLEDFKAQGAQFIQREYLS